MTATKDNAITRELARLREIAGAASDLLALIDLPTNCFITCDGLVRTQTVATLRKALKKARG